MPEPDKPKKSSSSGKFLRSVSSTISKATSPIDRNFDSLTSKAKNAVKAKNKEIKGMNSDAFSALRKFGTDGKGKMKGFWSRGKESDDDSSSGSTASSGWHFGERQPGIEDFCYPDDRRRCGSCTDSSPCRSCIAGGFHNRASGSTGGSSWSTGDRTSRYPQAMGYMNPLSGPSIRYAERMEENAQRLISVEPSISTLSTRDSKASTKSSLRTWVSVNEELATDGSFRSGIYKASTVSQEGLVKVDPVKHKPLTSSVCVDGLRLRTLAQNPGKFVEKTPRAQSDPINPTMRVEIPRRRVQSDDLDKERRVDPDLKRNWSVEYNGLITSIVDSFSLDERNGQHLPASKNPQIKTEEGVDLTEAIKDSLKSYLTIPNSDRLPPPPELPGPLATKKTEPATQSAAEDEHRPTSTAESGDTEFHTCSDYSESVYSRDSYSLLDFEPSSPGIYGLASVEFFIDKMRKAKEEKRMLDEEEKRISARAL